MLSDQRPVVWLSIAILVGALLLGTALAIQYYSFARGLDLSDESSSVYLISHPATVGFILDHFLWGRILPDGWTIVGLRYASLFLLLGSAAALCASAWRYLSRRIELRSRGLGIAMCFSLTMLGVLLYFSGLRPTLSYATSMVVACYIFAVAALWLADARSAKSQAILLLVLAMTLAVTWLARFAVCVPLLLLLFLFVGASTGRWKISALQALAVLAGGSFLLFLLWLAGCDIVRQLQLAALLSNVSHDPLRVIASDFRYGVVIASLAMLTALTLALAQHRLGEGQFSALGIGLLALASSIALILMIRHGDFAPVQAHNAFSQNPAIRSLGPAIHVVALSILLFQMVSLAACYFAPLRRWTGPERDRQRARVLFVLSAFLYFLSLLPEVGTNTGLWHRSVLSMAPLFLMIGLLCAGAVSDGGLPRWAVPLVMIFTALPVLAVLYCNGVTRPFRVDGSGSEQTVMLDHPAVLKGLMVSPSIAALQVSLDRTYRLLHVNPEVTPAFFGNGRPGIVLLTNGIMLGAPWYLKGYPNEEGWNCTLARMGAAFKPAQIVGIDVAKLGTPFRVCLPDYDFGEAMRAGGLAISILRPKS